MLTCQIAISVKSKGHLPSVSPVSKNNCHLAT